MWPNCKGAASLTEPDFRQEMLCEIAKLPTPAETFPKSLLRPEAPLFTLLGIEATATPVAACGGGRGEGGASVREPPKESMWGPTDCFGVLLGQSAKRKASEWCCHWRERRRRNNSERRQTYLHVDSLQAYIRDCKSGCASQTFKMGMLEHTSAPYISPPDRIQNHAQTMILRFTRA